MNDLADFDKRISETFSSYPLDAAEIRIDNMIIELLRTGFARQDILNILEKHRLLYEDEKKENELDLVTGFMDRLVGWCSPNMEY
jgi:hypothetical protein